MTSSSSYRPGLCPTDAPRGLAATGEPSGPPEGAVTLADLIADAGPLPPDAALECVQRLAERLTRTPAVTCAALGPADVLIDDDGGVWLKSAFDDASGSMTDGMNRLGRLLAFLTTGDGGRFGVDSAAVAAELPQPLSTVAGRLLSRNGACYRSYAELAREAATLRGVTPIVEESAPVAEPIEEVRTEETPSEPELPAAAVPEADEALPVETCVAVPDAEMSEATEPAKSGGLAGVALFAGAVVLAVIAYIVWQAL